MKYVTSYSKCLPQSKIRNMFNIASGMENVVNLALGEPDFPTPHNIIEAANKAILDGNTHYTLNAGIFSLRQAIANKYADIFNGSDVDPNSEIAITVGATEALFLLFSVILDPGDEVIITRPHWTNYANIIRACRGICRFVDIREEDGFEIDPDAVDEIITSRTKAIVINSPANPTGAVLSKDCLDGLARVCVKNDLLAVSDEVYRNFVYEGNEFVSIIQSPDMSNRTVIVDSFSKSYAMTGWRIGFAVGPSEIISTMIKYQENVAACNNNHAQYGALEALTGPQDEMNTMIEAYHKRRKYVLERLKKIDGVRCHPPDGAFYVYINVSHVEKDMEKFTMKLLKEGGVCMVPDTAFGHSGTGLMRMSYAASEEDLTEGLARFEHFVKEYRG